MNNVIDINKKDTRHPGRFNLKKFFEDKNPTIIFFDVANGRSNHDNEQITQIVYTFYDEAGMYYIAPLPIDEFVEIIKVNYPLFSEKDKNKIRNIVGV